jgi:CheY-like chemotaxis protein
LKTILIVEDVELNRDLLVQLLEDDYRLVLANDGLAALERAAEARPDLILMDLSLPRMDGWEATRRLKMDERTRHIPIVALTGHALAGSSEGAKKAGCDAFVTKPCLPDDLVVEVRRMLAAANKV